MALQTLEQSPDAILQRIDTIMQELQALRQMIQTMRQAKPTEDLTHRLLGSLGQGSTDELEAINEFVVTWQRFAE
jgi:hypothetical protein